MRRLTSRSRFALTFSLYVFIFFLLLSAIFLGIFNYLAQAQIEKDLEREAAEIIERHLFFEGENLSFKKDEKGSSLRELLVTHNLSAVFFDKNKQVLRTYGIFSLADGEAGADFIKLNAPLKNNGRIIGSMTLAKSNQEYLILKNQINFIFVFLGALNLLGSFLLGYFLTRQTFGFLVNASHELKTPLARAISSLELLPANPLVLQIKKDLFEINSLFEKLLLLKTSRKNFVSPEIYRLESKELIEKLRQRFKFTALAPQNFNLSLPKEYLLIILTNFLSNATKYGVGKEIFLTIKTFIDKVEISVKDQGEGLGKNEQEKMFNRFYRGKKAFGPGFGIGLSVVKQICDLYHLEIKVFSVKGEGTTVTLLLPEK